MTGSPATAEGTTDGPRTPRRLWRRLLIAFGLVNVGIGIVGVAVPGLPTTDFMLIALWAFARSSTRLHLWLYHHPRFGPSLRAWREERAISRRVKWFAIATIATSFAYLAMDAGVPWLVPALAGPLMAAVALYIVTRRDAVYPAWQATRRS